MADNNKINWTDFLGGIGSVASSGLNFLNQQMLNSQQMKFNREERIAAQEYNTSERLAVQDYNSPVNQMKRLMEAGINPNTAADMLSSSPSTAQSVSGASMSPQMTDIANPLGDLFMNVQQRAQTRLVNAQAEKQEIENNYLDDYYKLNNKQIESVINNVKQDTSYKKILEGKTEQEKKQIETLLPLMAKKSERELDQLNKAISLYEEEIKLREEQQKSERKNRQVMDSQISANYASAESSRASAESSRASAEESRASANSIDKSTIWKEKCRAVGFDPDSDLGSSIWQSLVIDPKAGAQQIHNLVSGVKQGIGQVREELGWDKYVPPRTTIGHVFPFQYNP